MEKQGRLRRTKELHVQLRFPFHLVALDKQTMQILVELVDASVRASLVCYQTLQECYPEDAGGVCGLVPNNCCRTKAMKRCTDSASSKAPAGATLEFVKMP